jgi:hypothetical protein
MIRDKQTRAYVVKGTAEGKSEKGRGVADDLHGAVSVGQTVFDLRVGGKPAPPRALACP